MTETTGSEPAGVDESIAQKQAMVEKLFEHTNAFLQDNQDDPLLVVEALAAILVRYTALFGPVEQIRDRMEVIRNLIAQECEQVQKIAQAQGANPPETS